jgi:sugar/nucleoside kinase (ribokinase family)
MAEELRTEGSRIIFEPNSVKDERTAKRAVKASHIVKYSTERIRTFSDAIGDTAGQILIETSGEEGLQSRTPTQDWTSLPAIPAETIIDAAGSGDWVTTGIIHAFLHSSNDSQNGINDATLDEGLRLGQALATLNCGFAGARGLTDHVDAKTALRLAHAALRENQPVSVDSTRVRIQDSAEVCMSCAWTSIKAQVPA